MKRPRKPAAAPTVVISKDLAIMAQAQLVDAYLSFLTNTANEDPKQFMIRAAAAQDAYNHIVQLRGFADDETAEPSQEEVLEGARGKMAGENKT